MFPDAHLALYSTLLPSLSFFCLSCLSGLGSWSDGHFLQGFYCHFLKWKWNWESSGKLTPEGSDEDFYPALGAQLLFHKIKILNSLSKHFLKAWETLCVKRKVQIQSLTLCRCFLGLESEMFSKGFSKHLFPSCWSYLGGCAAISRWNLGKLHLCGWTSECYCMPLGLLLFSVSWPTLQSLSAWPSYSTMLCLPSWTEILKSWAMPPLRFSSNCGSTSGKSSIQSSIIKNKNQKRLLLLLYSGYLFAYLLEF